MYEQWLTNTPPDESKALASKSKRHEDGDIESFALLSSMPIPEAALDLLPPTAVDANGSPIEPSKHYDITVSDIINVEDAGLFSLLKYSFNLTPAIRDELSKDLSSMLTELEPQLPDANQTTLRAGSIEHKKTFVMKHPPQMRFNPPT